MVKNKTLFATINRHIVAKNRKNGTLDGPIRTAIGKYGKANYSSSVTIFNPKSVTIQYKPYAPLNCGATAWIEVELPERKK